jgi:hypothetical protein
VGEIVQANSFTLDAPGSNLPPFDIAIPAGASPDEEAKKIVGGGKIVPTGSFALDESTIPGAGIVHTARAMAETGAGLATGIISFPVSQLRGLWEYAITLGDKKAAAAAEEAWSRAIQFEPTTDRTSVV